MDDGGGANESRKYLGGLTFAVCVSIQLTRGSGGMLPQENLKTACSEINSGAF